MLIEREKGGGGKLDSQEQLLKDAPTDIGIASWSPDYSHDKYRAVGSLCCNELGHIYKQRENREH
jgi:hypothetical protein